MRAKPNVRLVLLGGIYQPGSDSFSSDDSLESLSRIGLDAAFLSAGGIHAERGVSCSHFHEVAYKKRAMAAASRRYLVADTSKQGPHSAGLLRHHGRVRRHRDRGRRFDGGMIGRLPKFA